MSGSASEMTEEPLPFFIYNALFDRDLFHNNIATYRDHSCSLCVFASLGQKLRLHYDDRFTFPSGKMVDYYLKETMEEGVICK